MSDLTLGVVVGTVLGLAVVALGWSFARLCRGAGWLFEPPRRPRRRW